MSINVPAIENAWDIARTATRQKALAYVETDFTAKYFNWVKRGEPGDEKIQVTQVLNGKEGELRPRFERIVDEPEAQSHFVVVPWMGKEYQVSKEKIRQLSNLQMDIAEPLAREGMLPIEKVIWHGALLSGAAATRGDAITVHGITDAGAGSGTTARPLMLDGGTTAAKWDVAGAAPKDFNKLGSTLESYGFKRPYALFAPKGAIDAFNYPLPTAAATFGESTIRKYAESSGMFKGVIPFPRDLAANHIGTKAADTSENFQMYAIAMGSMAIGYTEDFGIKSLPYNEEGEYGIIRCGARCVPMFETIKVGNNTYKGVIEIAAIDLTT